MGDSGHAGRGTTDFWAGSAEAPRSTAARPRRRRKSRLQRTPSSQDPPGPVGASAGSRARPTSSAQTRVPGLRPRPVTGSCASQWDGGPQASPAQVWQRRGGLPGETLSQKTTANPRSSLHWSIWVTDSGPTLGGASDWTKLRKSRPRLSGRGCLAAARKPPGMRSSLITAAFSECVRSPHLGYARAHLCLLS